MSKPNLYWIPNENKGLYIGPFSTEREAERDAKSIGYKRKDIIILPEVSAKAVSKASREDQNND